MIIESITVKSFGALRDMTLDFSETVNVIEGENESGKSTLASFIKYMLFGFDTAEEEDKLSERCKRINWHTGVASGTMTVRVKDKRYLITRETTPTSTATGRPSYKEECSIIDMETGATAFGKVPAGEVFFGVSRDLFENTAFVGRVGDASINEGSVEESIENILFSASEKINNQRAISKIADKMEALVHKGGQGGVIFDLVKKRDELDEKLTMSDEDNKQILVKETELFDIKRERYDAEDKLNKLYDLDNCYKNVMLIQTFDKLSELEEECTAKVNAYNEFIEENTNLGYAPTDEYGTEFAFARRTYEDSRRELIRSLDQYEREKNAIGITREIESTIELADSLGGEEKILKDVDNFQLDFFKNIALVALGGIGALTSLICEIAISHILARIGFGILGAGSLALIGINVFLILMNKKSLGEVFAKFSVGTVADLKGKLSVIAEARAKRDGIAKATEDARLAVERAKIAFENAKSEVKRVMLRWDENAGDDDVDANLDKFAARLTSFLEKKHVLYEDKNTSELTVKEIRRTLADKNEIDIRAQVSPLKRKALSKINHDEIITGIAAYKAKIVEQDKLAYTVENELMLLKSRAGDPADIYSKMDLLDRRIDELKDKHKAYFVAEKAIESASDNMRSGISPRLGQYSTELMGIMTDKKYKNFDISSGLKVTYQSETGEMRSVDFLSGGTRDLAYIAVRMALIDMLYTEKPPICFDESFAHQDNIRARSMMKSVAHLAFEGYQSFVFTCRAREAALAEELVGSAEIFKLSSDETELLP